MQLYDTTLRDGMQQEGMSVSVDEKVRIALKLDELGIDFIEGGYPGSNPKDIEFFARMERERLSGASLAAFGATRRKGTKAGDDAGLRTLADAFPGIVTIVGKTWGLHVSKVLKVSRDENLRMIAESVGWLRGQGKRVIYDAEHFFDGYADDEAYALATLRAAARGRGGGALPVRHQRRDAARRGGARRGGRVGRARRAPRHPLPQRQ